jgi:hypothetical protein
LKKLTLNALSYFLLSFVLIGCQQQAGDEQAEEKQYNQNSKEVQSIETKTLDVRETVWNRLTEEHKMQIHGTWKDATVYQRVLRDNMGYNLDKTFIGKEVYIIEYPSNDNPTIGGIVVYADVKSHQLIGYGLRD